MMDRDINACTPVILCICLAFRRVVTVLILYCTPSQIQGHVTSSTNGMVYTSKINNDFLMKLLKRGAVLIR